MSFKFLFPGFLKHALTFSFDDGQVHDRRLVALFNKYNFKGTFHLNSDSIQNGNYTVNPDEVRELYKSHEIACHTYTHPFPSSLNRTQILNELYLDRQYLEGLAGYPVRGFSYPYGEYFDEFIDLASSVGLEYSRTVNSNPYLSVPTDFMRWNPTCHQSEVSKYTDNFLNFESHDNLTLFYIWGHSYEFDRDNNWDEFEQSIKPLSGKQEIWYATNIEIKDYLTAARGLKVSLDEHSFYNTTAFTIYLEINGEKVKINPGETKYI